MNRFRRWWSSLSFYWQIYLILVLFISLLVTIVDGVLEPFTVSLFLPPEDLERFRIFDSSSFTWIESVLWIIGVLLQSLVVVGLVIGLVRRKLDSVVHATQLIADGDLSTRVPDIGSGRDIFSNLSKYFNSMADSLQDSNRNEKRLMADISHELRSPLTRMSVAVSILEESGVPEGSAETLQMLENDIEHMNNLVEVLLIQGKNRAAHSEVKTQVNISALLTDLSTNFCILGREDKKRLVNEIEPGIVVSGYETKMRMIFENILSNAFFYTPPHSEVCIRAHTDGKEAVISIRDHGPGVPEDDLEKIFQIFFRTDTSRTRDSGGVGLGLSLAREAVAELNGRISASNTKPGLLITVQLPNGIKPAQKSNRDLD